VSFFTPYEGGRPYIFVSYAHADSRDVMEVITDMHGRGYRVWYDEGIEVGSEWPECIAEHLRGASLMLAFISKAYMRSDNCRREMHYALMKRIKVINIFLEETDMTPGMEMQIGNIFALMKYSMPGKLFYDRLYTAPPLLSARGLMETGGADENAPAAAPCAAETEKKPGAKKAEDKRLKAEREAEQEERREARRKARERAQQEKAAAPGDDETAAPKPAPEKPKKKKWTAGRITALAAAVLIFAAIVTLGIVGHFTGLTERVAVMLNTQEAQMLPASAKAEFSNETFENIAREYTGIAEGEIYVSDLASLTELRIMGANFYFGDEVTAENAHRITPEGTEIRDLSDLQYFTGLKTLCLNGQSLSSLATLPALSIQYLDISGSRVTSLEGVGRLTKLRELRAEKCPVTDLGDIRQCLDLRLLNLDGASVTDFTALKPLTKLTSVSLANCTTAELKTVLRMNSLTDASFTGCDLRGSFFRSFDRESAVTSLTLTNCTLDSTANISDFEALTTLTLISSGETLDWSELAELSALSTVNIDAPMESAVNRALKGTRVTVNILPDEPVSE